MKVLELFYKNYRNLKDGKFIPSDKINVIYGENAQGKTNLLESIWIFTGGRSFRGTKDSDLIRFGEKFLDVSLNIFSEGRNQELKIEVFEKKRKIKINSLEKSSPVDLVGKFCAVIFSPNHLMLIKDGPIIRRKFLDAAICQVKPGYAKLIAKYNHVLRQRNALLKDIKYHSELLDTLDIWDENLIIYAQSIIKTRLQYVDYLKKFSQEFHAGISSQKEVLDVRYEISNFSQDCDLGLEFFRERLKSTRKLDVTFGCTNFGPHRDDLKISLNEKSAKLFASQGQQRSIVLAIKLAEAEIFKKVFKKTPVILLDDVMSELDEHRQDFILNSIKENQVFITCCEPTAAIKLQNGQSFRVFDGEIV